MLTVSDNEAAEVLAHQVGLATVGEASFAGGVEGVRQALTGLGVRPDDEDEWYDGSGLSRDNVLTPATLLAVLGVAAAEEHPELRALLTGLPVGGFTGSLEYRFADAAPAARGRVRAKTGTLRGTSALAGVLTDLDGTSVAFVLMADRVPLLKTLAARRRARHGRGSDRWLPLLGRFEPMTTGGMIDWDLAINVGSRLAGSGPEVSRARGRGGGRRAPRRCPALDGAGP